MKNIHLHLGNRSYDILIGTGLIASAGRLLRRRGLRGEAVIISNRTVAARYGKVLKRSLDRAGIPNRTELIPDSERAKSFASLTSLIKRISSYDHGQGLFIIALGGGVTGDLAGAVAAFYKRGIPYVQIPTTLLAQVDSAIGGKVAIDLPIAKNLVGAFYQPRLVISDIGCLTSLPPRQLRNALAEVIKYGIIADPKLTSYLERHLDKLMHRNTTILEYIVARSSAIKARYVERDEYDKKGIRAALNYGHTIGHAIEAAAGYGGSYQHGEAVAIGMIGAAWIAHERGMLSAAAVRRIEHLIGAVGLPTRAPGEDVRAIYASLVRDKKFTAAANRFILPRAIGRVTVVERIAPASILKTVRHLVATKGARP